MAIDYFSDNAQINHQNFVSFEMLYLQNQIQLGKYFPTLPPYRSENHKISKYYSPEACFAQIQ